MAVRLLGPIDVVVDQEPRPVSGLRRKAVLAALALHCGETVSTQRLTEIVWAADAPATAANTLQSHISYLRGVLGSRTAILTRNPGYVLSPRGDSTDGTDSTCSFCSTDVQHAEHLLRRATRDHATQPVAAIADLKAALALWRGEALPGVTGLPWLENQARRLGRLQAQIRQTLTEARLAAGEHLSLLPDLQQMAFDQPLDEQVHAQLMLALYRSGRQAYALQAFHRLRRTLTEDFGIDPSPQLRDLETAILRQDPALNPPAPARFMPRPLTRQPGQARRPRWCHGP
jgi:DNA-binding SARP family transcriptional activator